MDWDVVFAVFVKPWKSMAIPDLARHVRSLGFEWIELPVRPGFACEPDTIEKSLPEAVRVLAEEGVRVLNVTVDLALSDERLYASSVAAGISLNRVMFPRVEGENYWEAENKARRALDSAIPWCEKYHYKIGVQNHSGMNVPVNAMGLHHMLDGYDPKWVGAVWDPAHNALEGEAPEPALDIVSSHLAIVNLKNVLWKRSDSPDSRQTDWQPYWTAGKDGLAAWPRVAAKLKQMAYHGPVCFSGEYSPGQEVYRMIVADLAFARACFAG